MTYPTGGYVRYVYGMNAQAEEGFLEVGAAQAVEERLEQLRVAGPVLVKALQQLTNNNHHSKGNGNENAQPSPYSTHSAPDRRGPSVRRARS